jgi:hypothetical protein
MNALAVAAALLALLAATPQPARALDAQAIARCHQDIAKGIRAVKRGRIAQVSRCLKYLDYDDCIETDSHTAIHENELRNWVAGDSSSCQQALASGSTIADFGPTVCADSWEDCDAEVPVIATLDDLVDCIVCSERGFDFAIRDEIGMSRPAPDDRDERQCTRRISRLVGTTVRKAVVDTARCADETGAKPFSCPIDASPDSRFGKALASFARNVETCEVDEGEAPGVLTHMCDGTATDAASLTACFEGLARCLACNTANEALGQSEDCAAFSAFPRCDGTF